MSVRLRVKWRNVNTGERQLVIWGSEEMLHGHSFCHTKETPFTCVYCDHSTYRKAVLKHHYENIHRGEIFHHDWLEDGRIACQYCRFSGTNEAVLSHKVTFHRQLFVTLEKNQIKFLWSPKILPIARMWTPSNIGLDLIPYKVKHRTEREENFSVPKLIVATMPIFHSASRKV